MKDLSTTRKVLIALSCVALLIAFWALGQRPTVLPGDEPTGRDATAESPVHVEDSATLEIPGDAVLGSSSFSVNPDHKYLVQLSLMVEKPEDSPGSATYLGYTLSCASDLDDEEGVSVGGTQNLVNGQPVTLEASALLPETQGAGYRCRVVVANPYEHVASVGSEIRVSLQWTATAVGSESVSIDLDRMLPRAIEPGESVELVSRTALPEPEDGGQVAVIAHIHSTTCTIVNGSREDGRAWCDEGSLDEAGSEVIYRIDVEQRYGPSTCVASKSYGVHIDGLVHHYVASLAEELGPDSDCEGGIAARITVHNEGPAPLVAHRQNTEVIVVYEL